MSLPVLPRLLLAAALAIGLATACGQPASRADLPATTAVAIGVVQGREAHSPLLGQPVTIEGVVTADFSADLGGWFVQDAGDGDPTTSDALFVLADGDTSPQARRGDRVRVSGTVVEHGREDGRSLTALRPSAIAVTGQGTVVPLAITEPPQDWEALEGMLLRIDAPLTITGQHDLQRRGVLVASFDGRLFMPTEVAAPGEAARQVAQDNARRKLLLDDASAAERPARIWYLPDGASSAPPRSGSVVTAAEGILDQRWGEYRLQLTAPLAIEPAPRPQPPTVAGNVRIAGFNLENLFNGDGRGGGFPTPRGARTPAQLQWQLAKLVATIQALDPDIAALMELENDGYDRHASIAQLTAALNAGGADWRFVETGQGPGTDAIRVGLLYRASRVRPTGAPAVLEGGPFDTRSRVPLAQAFRAGNGPAFVVVATHLKSKGCNEAQGDDRDQGDGQACWNAVRVDSAQRLKHWLDSDPTRASSKLVAIIGDFNAYAQEDPIRVFLEAGWQDAFAPPPGQVPAHSFIFDGQAGRLDHALLSPALAQRIVGAAKWHSNADESDNVGYQDAIDEQHRSSPWRSSDHDPLLIGFDLRTR
ncbi:ExeM/NucH family extracellular endonuclease [Luteimonas sp. RIT-PG2_3]